ncbi:MAG: cyclic nucleotide-binding domain-containing protein [Chloroflexi bacterium]|nr:cyclic nucleotide-binding domain-containing protein [Chloroflexota bacterium]MBU1746341.1 cyclic nucleotide-binding domain-containing protein [Chloroflexota bacterium]
MKTVQHRLGIGRPSKANRLIAWLTDLPGMSGAFETWLASLASAELERFLRRVIGFISRLNVDLAWLLNGQIGNDPELERDVKETVALYCRAYWKAHLLGDDVQVFAAYLVWRDAPEEYQELSRRLFAKLIEIGKVSAPATTLSTSYPPSPKDRADRDVQRAAQAASPRSAGNAARPSMDHTTSPRLTREEATLIPSSRAQDAVLSAVERVIFLREVPLFESMTIEQLRILASVSEERTYDEDEIIFAEGDIGDALYVIVCGRVGIDQKGRREGSVVRVGTRSSRQYFGEMAIFDEEPRSAAVIALEPTLLLCLRRAPLVALIRQDPNLALALIRVISLRLRDAHRQIAAKSVSRPRELEKLYDVLEQSSAEK